MLAEAAPAGIRQPHRTARRRPLDPLELQETVEQRRAERSRQVMPALAPIETGPGEAPPQGARSVHVHRQPGEEPLAARRQYVGALLGHQAAAPDQRLVKADA